MTLILPPLISVLILPILTLKLLKLKLILRTIAATTANNTNTNANIDSDENTTSIGRRGRLIGSLWDIVEGRLFGSSLPRTRAFSDSSLPT